jgi:hypothetical protein
VLPSATQCYGTQREVAIAVKSSVHGMLQKVARSNIAPSSRDGSVLCSSSRWASMASAAAGAPVTATAQPSRRRPTRRRLCFESVAHVVRCRVTGSG